LIILLVFKENRHGRYNVGIHSSNPPTTMIHGHALLTINWPLPKEKEGNNWEDVSYPLPVSRNIISKHVTRQTHHSFKYTSFHILYYTFPCQYYKLKQAHYFPWCKIDKIDWFLVLNATFSKLSVISWR
jgi:hypothetical protein